MCDPLLYLMDRIKQIKSIKQLVARRKGIKEISQPTAVVTSLTAWISNEQVYTILVISMELFMQASHHHLKKFMEQLSEIWEASAHCPERVEI